MALQESKLGRAVVDHLPLAVRKHLINRRIENLQRDPAREPTDGIIVTTEPQVIVDQKSPEQRLDEAMTLLEKKETMPAFVWITPDGNRTGAEELGKERLEGHALGAKVMWSSIDIFEKLNIPYVGIWVWSEDNEKGRSPQERENVFGLIKEYMPLLIERLEKKGARFIHLGRKDRMPQELAKILEEAEERTKKNTGPTVVAGIDYNWKHDLSAAINGYRESDKFGQEVTDDEAEEIFMNYWSKKYNLPPVDLLIRTSGVTRDSSLGLIVRDAEHVVIPEKLPSVKPYHFAEALLKFEGNPNQGK